MRSRRAKLVCIFGAVMAIALAMSTFDARAMQLQVGFAERDITPELNEDRPVWLAGYGHGRQATGVHDPLMARALVLSDGDRRIAVVSIDCVGLQLPQVDEIRRGLGEFDYVLVSSTHDHEAPDVIGIWGRSPLVRGVDDQYLSLLIERTIECVLDAGRQLRPVNARFGTASDDTLVRDSRLPEVKDGTVRVLRFDAPDAGADAQPVGLVVQWNSHPEALGSRNTLITADFPAATVEWLREKYSCPVLYLTGAVGGLMAPPRDRIHDDAGQLLHEGQFDYAWRYGQEVARLADTALAESRPLTMVPVQFEATRLAIPVDNPLYRTAKTLGVLTRKGIEWTGDPQQLDQPLRLANPAQRMAIETEVACLRLGELLVASIPGEIYPELVYGKYPDPAEENVDFPDAPLEASVAELMADRPWMLIGLSNDEVGYILPKRQWDLEPPFAYGRSQPQYGEVNSCGPETAPLLMDALKQGVRKLSGS